MLKRALLAALVAAFAVVSLGGTSSAQSRPVILLHGWNGNAASWATAKAAYEAKGYTVYALTLPYQGNIAGTTDGNADYVEAFIASHHLTDVQVDGHSLGGWLVLDLILLRRDPAITSGVLRDTGTGCVFGIPADQCPGSALIKALTAAPNSAVPVLNLSSKTTVLPGVDCLHTYSGLTHAQFQTDAAVDAAAIAWPGAC